MTRRWCKRHKTRCQLHSSATMVYRGMLSFRHGSNLAFFKAKAYIVDPSCCTAPMTKQPTINAIIEDSTGTVELKATSCSL